MSKQSPDSFHAYLVRSAVFDGKWEMPRIEAINEVPDNLILFSEIRTGNNFSSNQWVHFYTADCRFECLWNNPSKQLSKLKKFRGVISPDFSVYRDLPLSMQAMNVYRNHALAYWLSTKGIKVIPNVRWGDERSYEFCFDGFPRNSVVSVGSNGCIKDAADFECFKNGLAEMNKRLTPHTILVYGPAPDSLFAKYKENGIHIVAYPSEMEKIHDKSAKSGVA